MTTPSQNPVESSSATGLVLRVERPGHSPYELYIAAGLTVGRSEANTVSLTDDDKIERSHARVDVDNGVARLKCMHAAARMYLGPSEVSEIVLLDGVRFRIGDAEFKCISGLRQPVDITLACPYCGNRSEIRTGTPVRKCPCGENLLLLDLGPPDRRTVLLPQRFGTYRADRFIARGGMGLVLRGLAQDKSRVAIKVPLFSKETDKQDFDRFKREIAIMKGIRHPNVVKLIDYGHVGRINYLIMEWIDGNSLRDYIVDYHKRHQLPAFDLCRKWLEQICNGLVALHTKGIVHRDITPSNILIGADRVARIADLGIAKQMTSSTHDLTMTGEPLGTHDYMSPEQLAAPDAVDHRADLYALGVVAYELLTGLRPVGKWPPPSHVNHTVPRAFDEPLSRLLAQQPHDRYANAHEFLTATRHLHFAHDSFDDLSQQARGGASAAAADEIVVAEVVDGAVDRNHASSPISPNAPSTKAPLATAPEPNEANWIVTVIVWAIVAYAVHSYFGQFREPISPAPRSPKSIMVPAAPRPTTDPPPAAFQTNGANSS